MCRKESCWGSGDLWGQDSQVRVAPDGSTAAFLSRAPWQAGLSDTAGLTFASPGCHEAHRIIKDKCTFRILGMRYHGKDKKKLLMISSDCLLSPVLPTDTLHGVLNPQLTNICPCCLTEWETKVRILAR